MNKSHREPNVRLTQDSDDPTKLTMSDRVTGREVPVRSRELKDLRDAHNKLMALREELLRP